LFDSLLNNSRQLLDAVDLLGTTDFSILASFVPTRTAAQCKSRIGTLDGRKKYLTRVHWTEEEIALLKKGVSEHGKKGAWKRISIVVGTRSPISCAEKFVKENGDKPKRINLASVSDEDLARLEDIVERESRNGATSWIAVSRSMASSACSLTDRQCRSLWNKNSNRNDKPWNKDERDMIVSLLKDSDQSDTLLNIACLAMPSRRRYDVSKQINKEKKKAAMVKKASGLVLPVKVKNEIASETASSGKNHPTI
jgi:hypothetical protein